VTNTTGKVDSPGTNSVLPRGVTGAILVSGLALPLVIELAFSLKYGFLETPLTFLVKAPVLLIGHGIPLGVLVVIVKSLYQQRERHIPGIIGAGIGVFGIILVLNLVYWLDIYLGSASSTGGLVFTVIPIYGCLSIPLGYCCGWIVGKLFRFVQKTLTIR
jgi:hypothetical protein